MADSWRGGDGDGCDCWRRTGGNQNFNYSITLLIRSGSLFSHVRGSGDVRA